MYKKNLPVACKGDSHNSKTADIYFILLYVTSVNKKLSWCWQTCATHL